MMERSRREFLRSSVTSLAGASALSLGRVAGPQTGLLQAADVNETTVELQVATADDLQKALFQYRGSKRVLRLPRATSLTCPVREDLVGQEKSIHPLLVPENVSLDLNGSTLLLDLRSNSYGVRLSNDSAIRNGTIRVVASENKGSQACWHSGVSVGAAYGDGGTTAKPGYFSTVKNWVIENITIDQPFAASAIQLMSEACHGVIRNIRILDSSKCLIGVGMDWGSVGPIATADKEIPGMKKLWEQGLIYSTHPHDVLVENVDVGKLTRLVDGNDAGVRCSACHNITIKDVRVAEAATAVAIFGGDLGYEFARQDQRDAAHKGYVIEDVKIKKAHMYGLVLNGMADNVLRATKSHGYEPVLDPVQPGLKEPVIRRLDLRGPGAVSKAQGIYAVCLTKGLAEKLGLSDFKIGVHVEDWVAGFNFRGTRFDHNDQDKLIQGATSPATGVEFHD